MSFKMLVTRIAAGWTLGVVLLIPVTLAQEEGTALGEPLAAKETVPIARLVAAPEDYVGATVQVAGIVTDVCSKAGCWIKLAAVDDKDKQIRVKVEDGVIVFPMEAKGRHAVAEGVMTKKVLTLEQTVAYLQHQAEERGEEFDAESVTEPLTFYEIKGTGAVIR
jgi:hypothetical protein